jgi:hypothetical protein
MRNDPLNFRLTEPLPTYWWSVDPGDVNVGLSEWEGDACVASFHTDPDDTVDRLVVACQTGKIKLVVYETFQLFGWKMGEQQGSNFLTPELIGAMKHICRRAGVPMRRYRPVDHKALYKLMEFRPPQRKVRDWVSYGHGPHAKDSECLGEYHVRRSRPASWGKY